MFSCPFWPACSLVFDPSFFLSWTNNSEAPALSKDVEAAPAYQTPAPAATTSSATPVTPEKAQESADDQQWDDAAVVGQRNKAAAVATTSTEVLDMKNLAQGNDADNIAEKLKVEENKAKLAAAREGMERQAAQAKAEKEKKEQAAREKEAARAANSSGPSTGGIWASARMRAQQQNALPRMRMGPGVGGGGMGQNFDTSNEELFPDLGAADKILDQKQKAAPKAWPKKTAVGGGATWGAKAPKPKKAPAKPPMKRPEEEPKKDEPVAKKEETKNEEPKKEEPAKVEPAAAPVVPAVPVIKPKKTTAGKKKKKKDLSTFKAGGN